MNRFVVLASLFMVGLAACGGLDDGNNTFGNNWDNTGNNGGNNTPPNPFVPAPDATLAADGGGDTIIFPDGGSVADGGSISDGGSSPDGGNTPDGGAQPDAGTQPDGGMVTYGSMTWTAPAALVTGDGSEIEWTVINWDAFSCPGLDDRPQQQAAWPNWKCGTTSLRGRQITLQFKEFARIAPGQLFQVYARNTTTDTKRYGCNGWLQPATPNNPYREINGTGSISYPNGNVGVLAPVNVDISASGAANCIAPVGSLPPADGGVQPDAGATPPDGGNTPDGGTDGGVVVDGGADGGIRPDGGTPPDGGVSADACNDVYWNLFPSGSYKHMTTGWLGFKVTFPAWVLESEEADIEYMVEEYYRDFGSCYDTARAMIRADGGTLVGPTQNFMATTAPAISNLVIVIPEDPAYQPYGNGGAIAGLYTHKPYYTAEPIQNHCIVAWWGTPWVTRPDGGSGYSQDPFTQGVAHAIPHEFMHWFNWLTRGTNDVDHENFNRDTAFQQCQGYSINDSCVVDP